ncbi:MAG: PH domain-containing protein [Oscillospiraceae bacterium]
MKIYHADTGALQLLQILICTVSAVLDVLVGIFLNSFPIIMWSITAVFTIVAVLLSFFILPLFFKNFCFIVTDSKIMVSMGIFFKRKQSVRLDRVQFVQVITGAFDGILGLNFIILHVYGGRLMMMFLNKNDRNEITALLQQKGVFYAP